MTPTYPLPIANWDPTAAYAKSDLQKHLQAACNLELWTIPIYLTAAYSITTDASVILPSPPSATSTVGNLLISVALQEMFHLQLACNLAGALGIDPVLNFPTYDSADTSLPYVSSPALKQTLQAKLAETSPTSGTLLGIATDLSLIDVLIAVETPDPAETADSTSINYHDNCAQDYPYYKSIGDLYSVTKQLVDKYIATVAPTISNTPQFANGLFGQWYPTTAQRNWSSTAGEIANEDDVNLVTSIIIEQGEGAVGMSQAAPLSPTELPTSSDPFATEETFSHVERFSLVRQNTSQLATFVPSTSSPADQNNLSAIFTQLIDNINSSWNTSIDLSPMFYIRPAMIKVFQAGDIPRFNASSGGVTYAAAQLAIAPTNGATWDANVRYYFTKTDIAAMSVQGYDLTDEPTMKAIDNTVLGPNGSMPPSNPWTQQMTQSFINWQGSSSN